ncbi:plasmid mobilization protein [Anaerosacchariphilus polymeriproducens]|uniref:Mobilization protein n=1 Tax=Anaerosacchariphilus polymeriproducens TaxID=1812858 RepID=A0A371AV15_9FIRM|nr:hypothetical protein [Anaerosacchariphilus polymeriproducens]RDU23415.1 hypothetical protein DWV06_09415 [Anaerosacchariphilus polymeriproducens]
MSKIYKRKSKKINKGKQQKGDLNRKRSLIVNFRMSPLERQILDERIKLSGLLKQDYMIQSSLYQKVVTVGNIRVFQEMKKQIIETNNHLMQIKYLGDVDIVKLESFRMIVEILKGLDLDILEEAN